MKSDLEHINRQWNESIEDYFKGTYPLNYFDAGHPSRILLKAGIPDLPVRLSIVTLKSFDHEERHPELKQKDTFLSLPELLANPIFIFFYRGKEKYKNAIGFNIIVDKIVNDNIVKYLLVGLQIRNVGNNRCVLLVNDIRTIFGKPKQDIISWIKNGKMLFAGLKKMSRFFDEPDPSMGSAGSETTQMKNILYEPGPSMGPAGSDVIHFLKNKYKAFMSDDQIFLPQNIEKHIYEPQLAGIGVTGYQGLTKNFGSGGVDKTVAEAWKIIEKYHGQVTGLANMLKGKNLIESAHNIWRYSNRIAEGGHINYANDDPGKEQLRTPARTWHDRFRGVDCDDFSIWSASLLIEMGYKPDLIVVGFDGNDYSHIFTGVNSKVVDGKLVCDVLLDPVMDDKFNFVLQNISKIKIYKMKIEQLSGVPGYGLPVSDRTVIAGYTGVAFADDMSLTLLGLADDLKKRASLSGLSGKQRRDRSKINFLIAHNASLYRDPLQYAMPFIDEVLPDGRLVFRSEELAKLISLFLNESHQIIESELSGLTDNELDSLYFDDPMVMDQVLGDLGRRKKHHHRLKNFWQKVKGNIHHAWQKTKEAVTKAAKAIKKVGGKVFHAAKKVVMAPMRGAFLLIIRFNVFGLATKMYVGRLSQHEATQKGISTADWRKANAGYLKIRSFFVKAGGNANMLAAALSHGWHKRPVLARKIKQMQSSLHGLGVVGTTAIVGAVGASTPFWKKAINWLKGINWKHIISKISFKKKDGSKKTDMPVPDDFTDDESLPDFTNKSGEDYTRGGEPDDGSGSSTGKTVAIIALSALGLYAVTKIV